MILSFLVLLIPYSLVSATLAINISTRDKIEEVDRKSACTSVLINTCFVQVDNDILKWLLKGAIAMMTQVAIGAAPAIAALSTDH